MKPFSTIAKRVLVAGSLILVTACGSNGITEPSAKKSGYITVSATVTATAPVAAPAPTPVKAPAPTTKLPTTTTTSGYNVPAN